jgi:hypothetical protein
MRAVRPRVIEPAGALALAIGLAGLAWAQAPSIYQRKTTSSAVIANSRGLYDGSYSLIGESGICGEIPKEASLTGTDVFVVENFPSDPKPNDPITSISFGSKELVRGATKSTVFALNISVLTANGGRPPVYVLRTDVSGSGDVGVATLAQLGAETTLHVTGRNSMGATIDLKVKCM